MEFDTLVIAGSLNFLAALLHIGVIIGGAPWYRFFGAGEALATLAEQGAIKPTILTLLIALVLFCWGLIAWSGAGLIPSLPYIKPALVCITAVYILRGSAGLVAPFVSKHPKIKENRTRFWLVSSIVCLMFAAFHLHGLVSHWSSM